MYTYGYIREATMAHLDLNESEAQAMNVLQRFPIFANEAIQAISACKPKYEYFKAIIVKEFRPLKETINSNYVIEYEPVTDEEWTIIKDGGHLTLDNQEVNLADEYDLREYYKNKDTYLVNEIIQMKDNFISFTDKQSFKIVEINVFNSEEFIISDNEIKKEIKRVKKDVDYKTDLLFVGQNELVFLQPGEYYVPYKAFWYRFESAQSDETELDIPSDIITCIPLYIASVILQIDNLQKAQIIRSEFEMAVARINVTNNMPVNAITQTIR